MPIVINHDVRLKHITFQFLSLLLLRFLIITFHGNISIAAYDDNHQCGSSSTESSSSPSQCQSSTTSSQSTATTSSNHDEQQQQQHHDHHSPCWLYLAPSTLGNNNELGLFAGKRTPRGSMIGNPEIVIQLIDMTLSPPSSSSTTTTPIPPSPLSTIVVDGYKTGGQFESKKSVHSLIPGIGIMAQKHSRRHNVIPYRADVDEGDVPRTTSAGSGAITHYHNFTFFGYRELRGGDELFLKGVRGEDDGATSGDASRADDVGHRDLNWLRQNGRCVDNIKPAKSKIRHAGRGAVASRLIKKGTVVAPAPLLVISDKSILDMMRRNGSKKKVIYKGRQLLLNYCLGNKKSSLLFYPYGSVVNLINHDSKKPNAVLRWSDMPHPGREWVKGDGLPLEELLKRTSSDDDYSSSTLVLDIVATRFILPNEEITIDYGMEWDTAWKEHKSRWKPLPDAQQYTPAFVMDDVASVIRTEKEQVDAPYDEYLIIACFYRYNETLSEHGTNGKDEGEDDDDDMTNAIKWTPTSGVFQYDYLRPCQIIARDEIYDDNTDSKMTYYTAIMKNRPGMPLHQRVPTTSSTKRRKKRRHIVNRIPRQAIRFMDDAYTSDQHLSGAFRKEIGIPDEIFPRNWMDLS